MGHSNSLPEAVSYAGELQNKMGRELDVMKQAATLSYEEFLQLIKDLNKTTASFVDRRGKQLRFSVCRGTDSSVLWKGTVRIRCQKIIANLKVIESCRVLNLRQFIILYREIMEQVRNLNTSASSQDNSDCMTSLFFNEVEQISNHSEESECCICMERKSEIVLSCMHRFCETCIDSWNISHKTCPVCRALVQSMDDSWVLTEKPDRMEYNSQVRGYLVGLVDRIGEAQ